jgi:hypothetical protein
MQISQEYEMKIEGEEGLKPPFEYKDKLDQFFDEEKKSSDDDSDSDSDTDNSSYEL